MKKVIALAVVVVLSVGSQGIAYSAEGMYPWRVVNNTVTTLDKNLEDGSMIGLGVSYPERPYKGMDNDAVVMPLVIAEYKQFFMNAVVMGYYFNKPTEALRFGIIGAPYFGGYHSSDSSDLAGMEDRDMGFDSGVRMNWKNSFFNLNVDALTDISGTSEGQQVNVGVSKVFFHGFLKPKAGIIWQSAESVDYYYGVKAGEATGARSEYSPHSELEYFLGLRMGIPLGEKWAIVSDVQANFLGSEVKDSPIVDESALMRYTLGMVYRF